MFLVILFVCHVAFGGCTILASEQVVTEAQCKAAIADMDQKKPEGAYFNGECFRVNGPGYKLTEEDIDGIQKRLAPAKVKSDSDA